MGKRKLYPWALEKSMLSDCNWILPSTLTVAPSRSALTNIKPPGESPFGAKACALNERITQPGADVVKLTMEPGRSVNVVEDVKLNVLLCATSIRLAVMLQFETAAGATLRDASGASPFPAMPAMERENRAAAVTVIKSDMRIIIYP